MSLISNYSAVLWQVVLDLGSLQNSHEGQISCLGLSADGSALCTGSWDTNLKVSPFMPGSVILFRHAMCLQENANFTNFFDFISYCICFHVKIMWGNVAVYINAFLASLTILWHIDLLYIYKCFMHFWSGTISISVILFSNLGKQDISNLC